jgi:tetratricopeptide (TPR) repeat protein
VTFRDVSNPTADVIGRGGELEAVDRFFRLASDGAASLLMEGEAGIGKTVLWRASLERARQIGARVLRSAPAESERTLTLGVLTDVLSEVSGEELAPLPAVQRHALEIALLRAAPSGQLPDQRTLSVATASLLRNLAATAPLVVAIDDAQWLDDGSASILSYALRRLVDRPVRILLAVRGAPGERALELEGAVPAERRERLEIGPMPLAALHRLFMARFGRSFPRLVLVRIEAASGGNPFYALEIARTVAASPAAPTPGERLGIPEHLGGLVEGRIAALPDATRSALLLAAVAAEPTLDTLHRADPAAAEALEAAIAAGIVAIDRGAIRFAHPLLAQAATATAGPRDLRDANAILARSATSDDARARHLGDATEGPQEDVAAALEAAAANARSRGATLDAAALYERASRLTPEPLADEVLRRAMLAAECLFIDVSEIVQADAILERAIATAPAGRMRGLALSLRAIIRYYHGQTPDAVRLGEQAVAEVGDAPVARATVLGRAAFLVAQLDLAQAYELVEQALAVLAPLGDDVDPDLLANVVLLHASAALGLVKGIDEAEIERGTRLITESGRTWEHDGADGIALGLARQTDELDRAIAMTEHLIRIKAGPGGDDPFNYVMLSGLQVFNGDWAAARANAERGLEGYAREGAEVFPSWGLRGVALVAAHDGRSDEARRLATDGLGLAIERGDLALQVYHRHILGFLALSLGDYRTADEELTLAGTLAEASGTRHPGRFKVDGDRLEAAIGVGALDRAGEIARFLEHVADAAPTPWTLASGLELGAS